jgi:thiol-disulfide isomerase/thioredoxin
MKNKIKTGFNKIKAKRWETATIILAVISIVLATILSQSMFGSAKKAADKAVEYINKNGLASGIQVTLSSIDKETINNLNLRKVTFDVAGTKVASYISFDGKYLFAQAPFDLNTNLDSASTARSTGTVESTGVQLEGGFNEAKDTNVCMENEKPIIYFFGSSTCPHCKWEEPILKSVITEFGDAISYHENIDSETDIDVFNKYSTGSVPTLVIGCKYYRIGSGEASGEEAEKIALKKIICTATGNQPSSICQ